MARSGKVVALDAATGSVVWTGRVGGLGYTTPAVSGERVFVGGFDGRIRALRATTGGELWSTWVGGRILGAPVVIGENVFFSTLEKTDLRRARVRREDRLAPTARQVLARDRDREDLLLLAERTAHCLPRARRPAGVVTGGWRRRQSGERWVAETAAFQALEITR